MKRILLTCAAALLAAQSHAATFSADTATASSFFNSSYAPVNTINGTGMPNPSNVQPTDSHALYVAGNHWTTAGGTNPTTQSITWGFTPTSGVDLGGLYIWNHRSTVPGNGGVADNDFYEPVLFDLLISDTGGGALASFTDVALAPDTASSQAFTLGSVMSGVGSVTFFVKQTQGSTTFTGLAEVLFDDATISGATSLNAAPVPLPAGLPLLLAGLGGLALMRRRAT